MQKNKKVKKIVMTGGHAGATAYAFIEQIKSKKYGSKLFWIGSGKAIEGRKVATYEAEVLPGLGVEFHSLFVGRLQTKFSFWTIPSLIKLPFGFIHAFYLLLKIRPDIVVSFGGYAAFPVVFDAWLLGIPIIIHEQTIVYGRSNKLSAPFAAKIALAREESIKYFPEAKCVVTGNPTSSEIIKISPKTTMNKPPELFITGGSRGSTAINDVIDQTLEKLLSTYKVIHQTGSLQEQKFMERRNQLPEHLRESYEVYGFIKPPELKRIMEKSDILVSRAGANIVSEIVMAKRPALLIPLPIAFMDEQKKNALYAKKFGIAEILDQNDLNETSFIELLEKIRTNWTKYVKNVKDKRSADIDAADNFTELVMSYLHKN